MTMIFTEITSEEVDSSLVLKSMKLMFVITDLLKSDIVYRILYVERRIIQLFRFYENTSVNGTIR